MEKYNIPEEILSKIPDYFWPAFIGELVAVYGLDVFKPVDGFPPIDFITGTYGWNNVFHFTCKKLNMDWLYDYYDKLEWWESDMFDGELVDILTEKITKIENDGNNPYYRWIEAILTQHPNEWIVGMDGSFMCPFCKEVHRYIDNVNACTKCGAELAYKE